MNEKIFNEFDNLSKLIKEEDERKCFIALYHCILVSYMNNSVCNLFENENVNNFIFKNGFVNILKKSDNIYVIEIYQYNSKKDESYYIFYIIDGVFSMLFNSYLVPKYPTTLDMFIDVEQKVKDFEIELEIFDKSKETYLNLFRNTLTDLLSRAMTEICIINIAQNRNEYLIENKEYNSPIFSINPIYSKAFRTEMLNSIKSSLKFIEIISQCNNSDSNTLFAEILKNKIMRYIVAINVNNILLEKDYDGYSFNVIKF